MDGAARKSPPARAWDLREPPDAEGTGDAAAALPLGLARGMFERFPNSRQALGKGVAGEAESGLREGARDAAERLKKDLL